jgi:hypothetical protein
MTKTPTDEDARQWVIRSVTETQQSSVRNESDPTVLREHLGALSRMCAQDLHAGNVASARKWAAYAVAAWALLDEGWRRDAAVDAAAALRR